MRPNGDVLSPPQLNKDHAKRPTALQALQHPWLRGPGTSERGQGKRLAIGVVQRIQRYSQVGRLGAGASGAGKRWA